MSVPHISILLPVRNAERWLPSCLETLFAQTFRDFEILALDHGSTDASLSVLEVYAQEDPRLKPFACANAESLPKLLNAGLEWCQGRYIARMDADDRCRPERLERQMALLQAKPKVGVAGCLVEMIGEHALPVSAGYREYAEWLNRLVRWEDIQRELFVESPLPHPTWLVRREVYETLAGYEDDGTPEDYGFLLRAAEAGWHLEKVPEVLVEWRDHGLRHSRTHPRYSRQAFFRLKSRALQTMVVQGRPCVVYGAGERARLLVRYLLARGVRVEYAITKDGGRQTSIQGIPVVQASEAPRVLPGPMLACVGDSTAKPEIRAWAEEREWLEGEDWWLVS